MAKDERRITEVNKKLSQINDFQEVSNDWSPEKAVMAACLHRAVLDLEHLDRDVLVQMQHRALMRRAAVRSRRNKSNEVFKWLTVYRKDLINFLFTDDDEYLSAYYIAQHVFSDDWYSKLEMIRNKLRAHPNFVVSVDELIERGKEYQ